MRRAESEQRRFNRDSKLDLAVANVISDNVSVLLSDGAGGFAAATNFNAGDAPRAAHCAFLSAADFVELPALNGGLTGRALTRASSQTHLAPTR